MIKLHKPKLNCLQATTALFLSILNTKNHISLSFFYIYINNKETKYINTRRTRGEWFAECLGNIMGQSLTEL